MNQFGKLTDEQANQFVALGGYRASKPCGPIPCPPFVSSAPGGRDVTTFALTSVVTTYAINSQGVDGSTLSGRLTLEVPPAVDMLLGLDCRDADLSTDLAAYPRVAYQRVFAPGGLPRHDAGKLALLPPTCTPHVSWKTWDEDALIAWLADVRRPMFLTYHHEPMGDVDPAVYRTRSLRLAELAADEPFILGTGPIVTRYWLDEGNGDPTIWMTERDHFFGVDCYNGIATRYRTPDEMFGQAIEWGERFGLPVLIPEWGTERILGDTSGQGRAQVLRDGVRFLRLNGVTAVAWWNINLNRLTADPELSTFRTLVDVQ